MKTTKLSRRSLAGLLISATLASSAVVAQDDARIPRPRGPVLECCKCLGGTSKLSLNTGAATWTATPPGGPTVASVPASNPAWAMLLSPGSQWIGPAGGSSALGDHVYQTQFTSPNCTIASEIVISGRFLADNKGTLFVDGTLVATSGGTPNYGFLPGSLTSFSYTIPASLANGVHTIKLVGNNTSGPTGVVAEVTVTRKCSDRLYKDRDDRADCKDCQ